MYQHRTTLGAGIATALTTFALAACGDSYSAPPASTKADLSKYVAIGTSVSMGWQSDGVYSASQQQAWVKRLGAAAGTANFTIPAIASPGCQPPLMSPLGSFKRIDGTSVGTPSTVCAPNEAGVSLPTNDLAVENATAVEGLNATPETATHGRGPLTSRVLPPGKTQVTAMRALQPTFVSVEFGGNEVLPAQVGVLAPNGTYTPVATFEAAYTKIIDSVKATVPRALLVTLPKDIRQFPTIRTGTEIAAQRTAFAAFNVTVNANCDASANFVFVRGKVLTAIATGAGRAQAGLGPYDLSCADAPGTVDYILTPTDVAFINDQLLAPMNVIIEKKASDNKYAVSSLEALYATSKDGVAFNLQAFLGSATPYGPKISLDGVHPSAEGQRILANDAIRAINDRYGNAIASIAAP